MTFGQKVLRFYKQLEIDNPLPQGIDVMNPYRENACFEVCTMFYSKYYNDNDKRFAILGINPGRHGAGLTGIPFTDPVKLESIFGISNSFQKKPELSADFIHQMIGAFGGHEKFFSRFFINSVSPLGFTKEGKNLNYYDSPLLLRAVEPFIVKSLQKQLDFGIHRSVAFCLGEGENYRYLALINEKQRFFDRIVPLAHPRFIMQYKRKQLKKYVDDYLRKLGAAD